MLTIATLNVNSIKARLANLLAWLEAARPDVVGLQETKCLDEAFPREPIAELGYNVATLGQKTYNGVAVLSRPRIEEVNPGLPGDPSDTQARYLEVVAGGVRMASIYAPNGNPVGSDKFAYKLAWLERLKAHAAALLELGEPVILAGDFNIIPEPRDCHDPAAWAADALFQPESRRAFRALCHQGWVDAFRALHPDERAAYTFWDYQGGAFQLDHGVRIDHILLSPAAADRLEAAWIDKEPRRQPKASDHTPVLCRLRDG